MSKREWKPCDVAMVTIYGEEHVALRQWDAWINAYADRARDLGPVESARPLVVIDPEDREQVTLLNELIQVQPQADTRPLVDVLRDALREFANPTPPKPDEPMGLGAVVEDAHGRRYQRTERERHAWLRSDVPLGAVIDWREYDEIDAVRVLSEGVHL